jgi:general secretion pathway protein A
MAAMAEASPIARRFAHPATDRIWLGPTQQSGLNHLCAELQVRVLIGPESSGKTTLLRHFPQHVDDVLALPVPGPKQSRSELLSALLQAAALGVADLTEAEQRNLLRVFLEQRGIGTRIIICADEVAGYAGPVWAEIERLLSLRSGNKPLVELAMVCTEADAASSPLSKVIQSGTTSAVEAVRYLAPPAEDDIRRYIAWRLERVGVRRTFSVEALGRITELCEGRYARVNQLCESIFSSQPWSPESVIDVDAVNRAAGLAPEPAAVAPEPAAVAPEPAAVAPEPAAVAPEPSAVAPGPPAVASEPAASAGPLAISMDEVLPDRLVISRNGKIERIVALNRRLVIGRANTSDLVLDGRYVCRHHAMMMPSEDGRFAIVDLNSVSGVFVNGKRVKRKILRNGDIVDLGLYRLKLIAVEDIARTKTGARPAIEAGAARETSERALAPAV